MRCKWQIPFYCNGKVQETQFPAGIQGQRPKAFYPSFLAISS